VNTRIEHDLLGAKAVPMQAYWGVHTARAVENFPITGTSIGRYADLIAALAAVKQAAARTNAELGLLGAAQAEAIEAACEEIRAGQLADQFVVDVIQGGARCTRSGVAIWRRSPRSSGSGGPVECSSPTTSMPIIVDYCAPAGFQQSCTTICVRMPTGRCP
jgi:Lyase